MLICSTCGTENPDGAKFCMECATTLSASASSGGARKIISALFCDLVGSTTLGEQHDPEVLRPILDGYFTEMSSALERHGGRVQKFIGDAVVAVFSLPTAHEDDALRAVRAGIEMQERLQTLNEASPIPLAARIGITTGEVRDDLERYFNEEECGLLLLRSHNYLVRLTAAVDAALASKAP